MQAPVSKLRLQGRPSVFQQHTMNSTPQAIDAWRPQAGRVHNPGLDINHNPRYQIVFDKTSGPAQQLFTKVYKPIRPDYPIDSWRHPQDLRFDVYDGVKLQSDPHFNQFNKKFLIDPHTGRILRKVRGGVEVL